MEVALDGLNFEVTPEKDGSPSMTVGSRASQPGDGRLTYAEWRVDGHDLNGFEVIPPGATQGYLGRSYGANTDGRDLGLDHLGPLINTITLSTHDTGTGNGALNVAGGLDGSFGLGPVEIVGDSTGSSNGSAQIKRQGIPYQYVIRGSRPAKIDLQTMQLKNAGLLLAQPATDIVATTPASTTVRSEVSIGVGEGSPYVSVTEPNVGVAPTTDTWAANSASQSAEQFGVAPDRTVLVTGNTVRGNIQTGAVTMTSPNWSTLFTLPIGVTGTGFALDGNLWVLGTNEGPQVVDGASGDPFPLIPELSRDSDHCRQMGTWFALGVVMPLRRALRWQRNGAGKSFGPETFLANTSPVTGQPTATAASERELFTVEYNVTTGDAYLIAWYERRAGDQHSGPLSPYVLARFTGKQSRFLTWLGTVDGVRTNDTLLGGYGSDAFWVTCGRTQRWIDDANYLMAASGTTYGTETRRDLDTLKDVEFVEFDAAGSCFPGDVIVDSETPIKRVFRRWFTGDLIEITTASGHQLSGTPNHPVLTNRGWVALGALTENDRVVSTQSSQWARPSSPDVQNVPAIFSEVFEFAALHGIMKRVPSSVVDFHGDGTDGEVDVVTVERDFWNRFNAERPQPVRELGRSEMLLAQSSLSLQGDSEQVAPAFAEQAPLGIGHAAQPQGGGFTPGSDRDTSGTDESGNEPPTYSTLIPDVSGGSPVDVLINDVVSVKHSPVVLPSGAMSSTGLTDDPINGHFRDSEGSPDLSGALSGEVTFDDVVTIRRVPFSGHVYNLETEDHRYRANHIVVHNCDANKTITVGLTLDDTLNTFAAVTSTGVKRLYAATAGVPLAAFQGIYRIAPQWTFASNSTTAGPRIRGTFRVYYRLRPTTVRTWKVNLKLVEDAVDTPAGLEARLRAMVNSGAKLFESPDRETTPIYVKVMDVSDVKFTLTEVPEDSAGGLQRYVTVDLEEWTAAA